MMLSSLLIVAVHSAAQQTDSAAHDTFKLPKDYVEPPMEKGLYEMGFAGAKETLKRLLKGERDILEDSTRRTKQVRDEWKKNYVLWEKIRIQMQRLFTLTRKAKEGSSEDTYETLINTLQAKSRYRKQKLDTVINRVKICQSEIEKCVQDIRLCSKLMSEELQQMFSSITKFKWKRISHNRKEIKSECKRVLQLLKRIRKSTKGWKFRFKLEELITNAFAEEKGIEPAQETEDTPAGLFDGKELTPQVCKENLEALGLDLSFGIHAVDKQNKHSNETPVFPFDAMEFPDLPDLPKNNATNSSRKEFPDVVHRGNTHDFKICSA